MVGLILRLTAPATARWRCWRLFQVLGELQGTEREVLAEGETTGEEQVIDL